MDGKEKLIASGGIEGVIKFWSLSKYTFVNTPRFFKYCKDGVELFRLNFEDDIEIQEAVIDAEALDPNDLNYTLTVDCKEERLQQLDFTVDPNYKELAQKEAEEEQKNAEANQAKEEELKQFSELIKKATIPVWKLKDSPVFWQWLIKFATDNNFKLCWGACIETGKVEDVIFVSSFDERMFKSEFVEEKLQTFLQSYEAYEKE